MVVTVTAIEGEPMKLWLMAALTALITVSAYPGVAKARHKSVEMLLSFCDADELPAQQLCVAYIEGVSDGYRAHILNTASGEEPWCIPKVLTVVQVADVVVRGLKERPEWLPYNAGRVVPYVLSWAFPCD